MQNLFIFYVRAEIFYSESWSIATVLALNPSRILSVISIGISLYPKQFS